MGVIVAGVWEVAEATLFFVVPDVWLTRLAITHTYGYAIKACLAAVVVFDNTDCLDYAPGYLVLSRQPHGDPIVTIPRVTAIPSGNFRRWGSLPESIPAWR